MKYPSVKNSIKFNILAIYIDITKLIPKLLPINKPNAGVKYNIAGYPCALDIVSTFLLIKIFS